MGFRKPKFYFLARPNWDKDIEVGRRFVTTVTETQSGKELRSSLVDEPFRSIEFSVDPMSAEESSYMIRTMSKYQDDLLGVPNWPEGAFLNSAAASGQSELECDDLDNKEFEVNQEVIITGSDWTSYEVGTIVEIDGNTIRLKENLSSTWPIYSEVYPIIPARTEQGLTGQFHTDYYSGWKMSFQESLEVSSTSSTTTTTTTA